MSHSTHVGFNAPPLVAARKFRQACPLVCIEGAAWLNFVVGVGQCFFACRFLSLSLIPATAPWSVRLSNPRPIVVLVTRSSSAVGVGQICATCVNPFWTSLPVVG